MRFIDQHSHIATLKAALNKETEFGKTDLAVITNLYVGRPIYGSELFIA